jgi:hypothetical protein
MTNEHITLLTQITDALLEVCDGAQEQDAQGFNKPDSLTVRGSYPDTIPIAPLLLKYKKQIEGAGFNLMSMKAAVIAVSGDLPTYNWNEYKIEFGKHSGRTYKEMADDPDYWKCDKCGAINSTQTNGEECSWCNE